MKYAVRLRNYGSRTANGDGGMTTVQCPDGVTFTFSTCSLSSNGTNQTRGQIPQILYYRFVCCHDPFLRTVNKTIVVLLYHIWFWEVTEINTSGVCWSSNIVIIQCGLRLKIFSEDSFRDTSCTVIWETGMMHCFNLWVFL